MQKRIFISLLTLSAAAFGADANSLLRVDHYVKVKSTVPAIVGEATQIYVREVSHPGTVLRSASLAGKVVLFVHGAGTPAEVAFDVPYQDYSWMAYLANAGYDVFAMDMTGYGRSTRPAPMNDPCNLSEPQQMALIPGTLAAPCKATYPRNMTTLASDWNDIEAVVDHLRALRHVEKVSLVGWSLGGPRAGGYATRNPGKVDKLILLSPGYNRNGGINPPASVPTTPETVFNTQSRADLDANWDRQVSCPGQVDMAARESVWAEMLASDPVGATWGTGVRRAPLVAQGGWGQEQAAKTTAPALLIGAQLDVQVTPERVRQLYTDIGSKEKIFLDLACSSHNSLWEKNHLLLFQASLEFLSKGTVQGKKDGMLKVGY